MVDRSLQRNTFHQLEIFTLLEEWYLRFRAALCRSKYFDWASVEHPDKMCGSVFFTTQPAAYVSLGCFGLLCHIHFGWQEVFIEFDHTCNCMGGCRWPILIHAKHASWLSSSSFQRDVNNHPCQFSAFTVSCSLSIIARFKNAMMFVPSTFTSGLLGEVNDGWIPKR